MNLRTNVVEAVGFATEITTLVHDMRNPLSVIYGSAEMLISSKLSESQVQRIARNMYGASVRIKELLDEVLTRHSGTDKGVELSELRSLVTSAVDKVSLVAEAQSVQIIQSIPGNLMIKVDRQRIQRILVNLFVNALDAMPTGGAIRVSATAERHCVLIKVRDTGPGVDPQIRDQLFQPFVTAGKPDGLGLGLALSRQAVLDHGGQMWVESGSQGACFAFCLPSAEELTTLSEPVPAR